MTFDREAFERQKICAIKAQADDTDLRFLATKFVQESNRYDYAYHWTWLGSPIIQLPQDILVTQEIIWKCKPDLIIETGVAWGGSVVLHAAILELIGKGEVIAIDSTLPAHINLEINKYKFSNRIHLIKGNSVDNSVISKVQKYISNGKSVSVFLDSNHTHDHVLAELRAYGPLVTVGQYLTVYATAIETLTQPAHRNRPWGPGNSPMSALKYYLEETDRFQIEGILDMKSLCTFAPQGRLKCIR